MKHFRLTFLSLCSVIGLLLMFSIVVYAGEEGMPQMPKVQPKKSYTIQNADQGEELQEQRGYGDQEPMVRMMNLMMVGGSGMEGMDMSEMNMASNQPEQGHGHEGHKMDQASSTPSAKESSGPYELQSEITPMPPKVGTNVLEVSIHDKANQKPAKDLKLKAQVYMTSMDMGTEEPAVKEVSPGKYRIKVAFSMKGPWAVKLTLPQGNEKILNFDVGSSTH